MECEKFKNPKEGLLKRTTQTGPFLLRTLNSTLGKRQVHDAEGFNLRREQCGSREALVKGRTKRKITN